MKIASLQQKRSLNSTIVIITAMSVLLVQSDAVDFDEFLEKTSYAQLVKELICMTDTIALLNHRMDNDERRLIEDSILGKIVRITKLIPEVNLYSSPIDLTYLRYWLNLAKTSYVPRLILDELVLLENKFSDYFEHKE